MYFGCIDENCLPRPLSDRVEMNSLETYVGEITWVTEAVIFII